MSPRSAGSTRAESIVWVVDDDSDLCDAISMLLRAHRIRCRVFTDPNQFLDEIGDAPRGCVLLDVRMPGLSGFEVQARLSTMNIRIPVIFLSGHGDIPMAVRALQRGASDFLEKPIQGVGLIRRVREALKEDQKRDVRSRDRRDVAQRVASLSPRERQVADLIAKGLRNRQIAEALELSIRTVEMHRTRLMRRIGARSPGEIASIVAAGAGES